KNVTKGYTDIQVKVRDATSNDPWGASGSLMTEIAEATFNYGLFQEILEILDKRLNDHGKNWRHVLKALKLLEYLLLCGSENVLVYAKQNVHVIQTLNQFQYIDDEGRDQGINSN
ncbi:epsin 2-like protein, partial [Rozella allomycis CSF55]